MDFKLSKTHLLQQEMYRRFAVNEVKPLAEEMDETEASTEEEEGTDDGTEDDFYWPWWPWPF